MAGGVNRRPYFVTGVILLLADDLSCNHREKFGAFNIDTPRICMKNLSILALLISVSACGVVNPNAYATITKYDAANWKVAFAVVGNAWRCTGLAAGNGAANFTDLPAQTIPVDCIGMASSGTATLTPRAGTLFVDLTYRLDNGISGSVVLD